MMNNFLSRSLRMQVQNNRNMSRDSPPRTCPYIYIKNLYKLFLQNKLTDGFESLYVALSAQVLANWSNNILAFFHILPCREKVKVNPKLLLFCRKTCQCKILQN